MSRLAEYHYVVMILALRDGLLRWPTTVTAKQKVTALQTLLKTMLSDGKTKLTHGRTPLIYGKTKLTHGKTMLMVFCRELILFCRQITLS